MAIEKTYFTDYDLTSVHEWFTANATEYFDSFQLNNNGYELVCKIGELEAMKIEQLSANGSFVTKVTFTGESGVSKSINLSSYWTNNTSYIRRITKTSKGISIALYVTEQGDGSGNRPDSIFITKDNKGNVAFVYENMLMSHPVSTKSSYLYVYGIKSYSAYLVSKVTYYQSFGFVKTDYIQLVPIGIPDQNVCYLPDCCISYYSNVLGQECTITQDGEKYFYNGFVALRE